MAFDSKKRFEEALRIDREFFKRHQKKLLRLANSRLGRWFFRIQEHPMSRQFVEILPNALIWKDGEKNVAEFRTANRFANKLRHSFGFLAKAVQLLSTLGVRSLASAEQVAFWLSPILFVGTVTNFFPDANAETTSVDGKATHTAGGLGSGVAWATLRGAAGNSSNDSAADELAARWVSDNVSNQWRIMDRGFFLFDTSALTSGATISSVDFSLYITILTAPTDATASKRELRIVSSNPASNTAITGTDYATIGSTEFGHVTYADVVLNDYNPVTLNASGISNVSKTGISKFGTLFGADMDNSAPTWASLETAAYQVRFAEQSGTSSDPKLVVTYTTTTSTTIQKSLQYCIKTTPATITKSLEYVITTTVTTAITKSLQYTVKTSLTIQKSLQYCIKITPATITKALAYNIAVPATITKALTYAINYIPVNIGILRGRVGSASIGVGSKAESNKGKSANTSIGIGSKL